MADTDRQRRFQQLLFALAIAALTVMFSVSGAACSTSRNSYNFARGKFFTADADRGRDLYVISWRVF
jgi:hypothetical protein